MDAVKSDLLTWHMVQLQDLIFVQQNWVSWPSTLSIFSWWDPIRPSSLRWVWPNHQLRWRRCNLFGGHTRRGLLTHKWHLTVYLQGSAGWPAGRECLRSDKVNCICLHTMVWMFLCYRRADNSDGRELRGRGNAGSEYMEYIYQI